MKLIIVAAIAGFGMTQDIVIGGGDHDMKHKEEDEYSDFTEEEISYQSQNPPGKEEFNPNTRDRKERPRHPKRPQRPIGEEEFNSNVDSEYCDQDELSGSSRGSDSNSDSNSESFSMERRSHRGRHDRQIRGHSQNEGPLIGEEEFNPFPGEQEEEEDWDRKHGKKKHHGKKGKHHGLKLTCFLLTALIFTLFGVCLSRCCQRRNKCIKKNRKMMEEKNRTSKDIEKKIKENYEEIEKLQTELEKKRQDEAKKIYHQTYRGGQVFYPQPQYQQRVMMQQPYPQQPQYYEENMKDKIPVGKPINASFESEYPQL